MRLAQVFYCKICNFEQLLLLISEEIVRQEFLIYFVCTALFRTVYSTIREFCCFLMFVDFCEKILCKPNKKYEYGLGKGYTALL